MSVPESHPIPEASQLRVQRLIHALARRIQSRRLTRLVPSTSPRIATDGAGVSVQAPAAGKIPQAEPRALLGRLVDSATRKTAASGSRMRGPRPSVRSSRGRG